jgi:uncharacterized protein YeaO (DUF488 family)
MPVQTKRVYDAPAPEDGMRVLVDRLWPRGLTKQAAAVDLWMKELAPSDALRKWYDHDPAHWEEFRQRYSAEIAGQTESLASLRAAARRGTVTLVYASRETQYNNATALRQVLARSR